MSKYKRMLRTIVGSVDYWSQAAMRHFVMEIDTRMKAADISRAALAEKMGTTPAYVTKVMRGDVNFTLETMTKIAMAVGGKLQIRVIDQAKPMSISKPIGLDQCTTMHLVGHLRMHLSQVEVPVKTEATKTLTLRRAAAVKPAQYVYEKAA
ncbi:MAG TPA: helix-turn-helix transcriptional regulator [Steroidobacteraceae bacterium]|nr:helix-turn-helix transcriptional regulator [Steroidobacteraceae bacterium]